MIYLLLYADSFRESAIKELGGAAKVRIIGEQHNLMIAELNSREIRNLDNARFIYSYFPLQRGRAIDRGRYIESIGAGFFGLKIGKTVPLKLECFDVNCKRGYSAKDVEVRIGMELEREGYNIDLESAKVLAYCTLMDNKCYWGRVDLSKHPHGFIDPFRENKEKLVSRAEFKIMEAFSEFGIRPPQVAIDIGAAPGGWSLFLAKKGASVIAIDSGRLEYGKIRDRGVKVRVAKDIGRLKINKEKLKAGSIVHIACGLGKAYPALRGLKVDFVGNDINAGGIDSSKAVMMYSELMKKDATLVMTLKCMHRNVERYIKEVEKALRPSFKIVRWKVLAHNRQEITLYAVRR